MKTLKGYIFSRPFFNERAPQHVQNIVIKEYCKTNGYSFLMSATEYAYKNSTFILHELIEELTTPEQKEAVEEYVNTAKNRSERDRMSLDALSIVDGMGAKRVANKLLKMVSPI